MKTPLKEAAKPSIIKVSETVHNYTINCVWLIKTKYPLIDYIDYLVRLMEKEVNKVLF